MTDQEWIDAHRQEIEVAAYHVYEIRQKYGQPGDPDTDWRLATGIVKCRKRLRAEHEEGSRKFDSD